MKIETNLDKYTNDFNEVVRIFDEEFETNGNKYSVMLTENENNFDIEVCICDKIFSFTNEYEESEFAARTIYDKIYEEGINPDDIAILYRTNAQSLNFERALKNKSIPHKVVGNIGFYQRKEVKDILSYLKFSSNKKDAHAFIRSITTPKRGIGNSTIDKVSSYAEDNEIDIVQALNADLKYLVKHRATLERYLSIIKHIEEIESIAEKVKYVIEAINYHELLKSNGEEPDTIERKMQNLDELVADAVRFQEANGSSLADFLASAALVTSGDEESESSVKLMTMHAAKGLEFKIVFLTGLEEGLFPLGNDEGETNIEEENSQPDPEDIEVDEVEDVVEEAANENKAFLNVTTHIDDSYVQEDDLKIEIHKIINSVDSREKFESVKLELEDDYPEWEYAKNSKLEEICVNTYEEITGKKPHITAIHAGLECGLLLDKMDGAEAISMGPDMFEVHTPNEHVSISSIKNVWDYLVKVLEAMNQY